MALSAEKLAIRETKQLNRGRSGIVIEADFEDPRTIQQLAEEQRRSMAAIRVPIEDVELTLLGANDG